MRPAELVRLLPLGALVLAGCPARDGRGERDRAPPLDEGAPDASTAPVPTSHAACGAASCAGGTCGGN